MVVNFGNPIVNTFEGLIIKLYDHIFIPNAT